MQKRILIIDKYTTIRNLFSEIFSDYNVISTSTEDDAELLFISHQPDLVFFDIHSLEFYGIPFTKKAKNANNVVQMIALSSHLQLELNKDVRTIDQCFSKPFDIEKIIKYVKQSNI